MVKMLKQCASGVNLPLKKRFGLRSWRVGLSYGRLIGCWIGCEKPVMHTVLHDWTHFLRWMNIRNQHGILVIT